MVKIERQDLVPPFAFGYFIPFFRLGDGTHPEHPGPMKYPLGKNISAGVFEDGMVVFDFARCEETPIVIHRESLWNGDGAEEDVAKRLQRTEHKQKLNQKFYRSVLLAHILLLENAGRMVGGVSFEIPSRIEKISDAFGCYGIPSSPPPRPTGKPVSEPSAPRLGTKAFERSFSDLNRALADGSGALLKALEYHKLSQYRALDHRFAESLVLSWMVCENMIHSIWKQMIDEVKSSDSGRMTGKRAEIPGKSSASTASGRIRILERVGRLSAEQATSLNEIRRARNDWLHSFKDVEEQIAFGSIGNCARLISSVCDIAMDRWSVAGAGGGGGGMFLNSFRERFPDVDLEGAYDG